MHPEPSSNAGGYVHRGTRAIQRMVEYAPSTGGLALWMHHRDDDDVDDRTLARTDGATIHYGAAFERLSLPRQTGIVAHEMLHVALRHVPRYAALQRQRGDVDLDLFNICADAIVNSALSNVPWLVVEPNAVRLETLIGTVLGIEVDAGRALLEWDVERLYRSVDDRRQPVARKTDLPTRQGGREAQSSTRQSRSRTWREQDDGPRASQTRILGRESRRDLIPGSDAGPPEAEAELAREWRERLLRGHAGDGSHSILRALLADLPQVRTPWEQLLRTRLARGLSLRRARSWTRPSRSYIANQGRMGPGRRMPWEPGGSYGDAVARLAVMVDVSGSVEDAILTRFSSEIAAITRRHEARVVVIIGDDRVRSVVHFEPGRTDLTRVKFHGGGSTDFAPLLQEADRYRPDIGVFLTDLKGPAEYRPTFPVLWTVPGPARRAPPFGRILVLN